MNEQRAKVAIAISTYNGGRYLKQQLQSIFDQDYKDITIFVRDDGSTDSTVKILEELKKNGSIVFFRGTNKGVVNSFLECLSNIPHTFDYIALCDQDDIWHSNKISSAVLALNRTDNSKPQLYFSELNFCDESLHFIRKSKLNKIGISFPLLLFDNICSGNTMMINRALADIAIHTGCTKIYCHDWWLAMIAASFGEIIYDHNATLEYRRTGTNVSPGGKSGISLLIYRIQTFLINRSIARIADQNTQFLSAFQNQMSAENVAILRLFCFGSRFRKCLFPSRLRQRVSDEIALRAILLLGRL